MGHAEQHIKGNIKDGKTELEKKWNKDMLSTNEECNTQDTETVVGKQLNKKGANEGIRQSYKDWKYSLKLENVTSTKELPTSEKIIFNKDKKK